MMTSTNPDDYDDVVLEYTPLLTQRTCSVINYEDARQPSTIRDGLPKMLALAAIVVCFFSFYLVPVLELNPYLYDMISRDYPKLNMSAQAPCTKNMYNTSKHDPDRKIQEEIEKRMSTLEMYFGLTSRLLAIVPVLTLGPLTDRYGRKIGFLCPVLGTWLKTIVYTLTIAYKWPVSVLYLGHIFEAVGGSFAAMFVAIFSVISDVTLPGKQRALIITVFEGLQTLTVAGAEVAFAHWFKISYLHPLLLACCLGFLTLFLVIFVLPETVVNNNAGERRVDLEKSSIKCACLPFRLLKSCIGIYFTDREGRLVLRRLCFLVFTLAIAVNLSKDGVLYLLLIKYPLCWPNSKILVFSGVSLTVKWVVIGLLMPVFQKALNMEDRHIAVLGTVSAFGMMVFLALAQNDVMVYEATAVGVLIRVTLPVVRSVMSSLVDKDDQGSMYASFGCMETLGDAVFGTVANRIYYATVGYFAGTIFFIFAAIYFLVLVFVIILNVLLNSRRPGNDGDPD